jgi:hypothetical protein
MTLIINNTEITQDENGRYSLNALHKSSGGKVKDLPNKFMASKSFKEVLNILIAENSAFEPVVKKQGRYTGGTWICKELVYKYAMWVSADFELKVIRTFDILMNKSDSPATLSALNELTREIEDHKDVASKCGEILAKYKKIKKQDSDDWEKAVASAQLSLGFGE